MYPGWGSRGGSGRVLYRVLTRVQPTARLRLIYGIYRLIGSYGRLTGIKLLLLRSEILGSRSWDTGSGSWIWVLDLVLDLGPGSGPDWSWIDL